MTDQRKLEISLLALRVGIASVFLVWVAYKIMIPETSQGVFTRFYHMTPGVDVVVIIGIIQLIIVLAFLAGIAKTWTYGAILVMHFVSTASTWERLIAPFDRPNILFWAAIPMLAATVALFLLRESDQLFVVKLRARD